jgi:hypothetical protein
LLPSDGSTGKGLLSMLEINRLNLIDNVSKTSVPKGRVFSNFLNFKLKDERKYPRYESL